MIIFHMRFKFLLSLIKFSTCVCKNQKALPSCWGWPPQVWIWDGRLQVCRVYTPCLMGYIGGPWSLFPSLCHIECCSLLICTHEMTVLILCFFPIWCLTCAYCICPWTCPLSSQCSSQLCSCHVSWPMLYTLHSLLHISLGEDIRPSY